MATSASSYWCYRCSRFVRVLNRHAAVCPDCDSGFIEEVETPPHRASRRRFPPAAMYMLRNRRSSSQNANFHFRRGRRNGGNGPPLDPVIVLRSPTGSGGTDGHGDGGGSYELYYDDGAGAGLRPLPARMSEFLMGSGFNRLLEQLSQIEINGSGHCEPPPASKAAVESMPTIEIASNHVITDLHCAVCKEPFKLGSQAREMPCKHIYHSDCILPWLSLRNSCPVCRHELPTDAPGRNSPELDTSPPVEQSSANAEEDTVGLTIWRLPTGGFAVGRFSGNRQSGERELPVAYTEIDGGFNTDGAPRRISWSSRGNRSRGSSGIGRVFSNFFSFFGRLRFSSGSSQRNQPTDSSLSRISRSSGFSRSFQGQAGTSVSEDENGISRL